MDKIDTLIDDFFNGLAVIVAVALFLLIGAVTLAYWPATAFVVFLVILCWGIGVIGRVYKARKH